MNIIIAKYLQCFSLLQSCHIPYTIAIAISFSLQAIPLFMAAIIVEYVVAVLKGKPALRFNDGLSSVGAGLMSQMSK